MSEWYDTLNANLDALGVYSPDAVKPILHAAAECVEWIETREGLSGKYRGRWLASRVAPRSEGGRLAQAVDIMENAVVVVPGFGLGYHVEAICRRMQCYGAIIVFEPDVSLLQEVLSRIDHSGWLSAYNVMVMTEPREMVEILGGIVTLVALGVTHMGYPAGATRLAEELPAYFEQLQNAIEWCRITLNTTISLEKISIQNELMNIDYYAKWGTIGGLQDWFKKPESRGMQDCCLWPKERNLPSEIIADTLSQPQDAAAAPPAVEAVGGPSVPVANASGSTLQM